jgi:hypothetical protein
VDAAALGLAHLREHAAQQRLHQRHAGGIGAARQAFGRRLQMRQRLLAQPEAGPQGSQRGEHLGAHREVAVALGQGRGTPHELQRLVDAVLVEVHLGLDHQAQRELAVGAEFARQFLGLQGQRARLCQGGIDRCLGLRVQRAQSAQPRGHGRTVGGVVT